MAPTAMSGDPPWTGVVTEAIRRTCDLEEIRSVVDATEREALRQRLEGLDDGPLTDAVSDEADRWLSALEAQRGVANRPRASPKERAEAEEDLEAARETLIEQLVQAALLPQARQYVNRLGRRRDDHAGVLTGGSGRGLDQIIPQGFQLRTSAAEHVARVMEQQKTAAIGIAGQRGSGKTTLIRNFTKPPTSTEHRAGRVLVSAPVQYDARDFLLHVFAEVCQSIAGRDVLPRASLAERAVSPRPMHAVAYHLWNLAVRLVVVASGLVAGYLVYRILDDVRLVAPVLSLLGIRVAAVRLIDPQLPVRQVGAMAAGAWILFNLGLFARSIRRRSSALAAMFRRLRGPDRPLYLAGGLVVLGAAGVTALWTSARIRLPDMSIVVTLGLAVCVLIMISAWRLAEREPLAPLSRSEHRAVIASAPSFRGDQVTALAREYLREIRFQQSFTSGWGGKISLSSPVGGGELNSTEGVTMARLSWTLPETVANLRALLALAAERYGQVVVGVDEVDKIEDAASARRFIDDLKAIFQVPGCYFLVSVSDDAVASFERRGLPFRDSFDSAFDEVISLDFGALDESVKILNSRVVGMPVPFACLCHVISGGLPRDLLRTARELYGMERPTEFAVAAAELVRNNLVAKVSLVARPSTRSNSASAVDVISWAQSAAEGFATSDELIGRLEDLAKVIRDVDADVSHEDESEKRRILRSCLECEAILLLAITIVDFAVAAQGPYVEPDEVEALAMLAPTKKLLALHPTIAVVKVQEFRRAQNLQPIPARAAT